MSWRICRSPNFHLDGDSDDDENRMSESECSESWYDLDADEQEALISQRGTEETSICDKVKKILPKGWRPLKENGKIHR